MNPNPVLAYIGPNLGAITAATTYDRLRSAEADAHSTILYWAVGYYETPGAVPVDVLRECMVAVRDAVHAWHDAQTLRA